MLAFLRVPLSWAQILRRTFKEAFYEDNCLGMAAQLAYYFFFALFPAMLFLLALASYFPAYALIDGLFRVMGGYVPPDALGIITDQIKKISSGEQGGLLTLGVLTALWSSSAAMTAIIDTLNRAYDIEEGRPWWKVRLTAIALTVGVSIFVLGSLALVLAGPEVMQRMLGTYFGQGFEVLWNVLRWPIIFILVSAGIAIIYYYAPDAEQDWVWLTPGSIVATSLWVLSSIGFKFYVENMSSYTESYGVVGGVMVLLLWFYISGLVILVGAEMNAEIEHASPYGKDEGEKVPGEKRKIGPARMRAWMAAQRMRRRAPSADEVEEAVNGETTPSLRPAYPFARPAAAGGSGVGDWIIGAGVLAAQVWFALAAWGRRQIT